MGKKKCDPVAVRDVPYVRCFSEAGMIETVPGVFTHCYEIEAPKYQKEITYSAKRVRDFMKAIYASLGTEGYSFQFVIRNSPVDREEYLSMIRLPHGRNGEINSCMDFYNEMLEQNVDVGHNNFRRHVYLVVSCECNTADQAVGRFEELDGVLKARFEGMYGYIAKPLSIEERLGLMYEIYHPGKSCEERKELSDRKITYEYMRRSRKNTKKLIAPDEVVYERTYIKTGGKYMRMLFINSFPTQLPDSLLCDLTAVSGDSILSASYVPMDSAVGYQAAKTLVENNTEEKTVAVRDTVEDRRSRRTETIKSVIRESEQEYFNAAAHSHFAEAMEKEEPLMLVNFVIALMADSLEDLDRDAELLRLSASRYACQIRVCDLLQKEALKTVLPLNNPKVNFARSFPLGKISSVFPLDVQHLFEKKPMFQGLNQINDNFIFADRRNCPVGLIAGVEKSGKTFSVKRDALNALMTSEDSVFILTKKPEEYRSFSETTGGEMVFLKPDPFMKDVDYALGDDPKFFQKMFLEAVMTMASGYYKGKLLSEEKQEWKQRITGEAEMIVYQGFAELSEALSYAGEKPEAFPMFLSAFGQSWVEQADSFGRVTILPCRDDVELLLRLDHLWNHAIAQKKANRTVWIYVDGIDELLYSDVVSDYLLAFMDKARKLRIPLTFVLDDSVHVVTDVDASIEFDYFLNKVQFFKLLSQGPIERKRYEERLNISRTLVPYITDREPGEGILITPSMNVAFTDRFEKDNAFYGLFR